MNNFHLIKLTKEYFDLPKGFLIENPNALNFICKIFDVCDVFITNKALKHIVESRKYKDKRDILYILEIISGLNHVLLSPDIIFLNEKTLNSIGLTKKIDRNKTVNNTIILEYIYEYNHYEIITAYEREDKDIQKLINIKHLIK